MSALLLGIGCFFTLPSVWPMPASSITRSTLRITPSNETPLAQTLGSKFTATSTIHSNSNNISSSQDLSSFTLKQSFFSSPYIIISCIFACQFIVHYLVNLVMPALIEEYPEGETFLMVIEKIMILSALPCSIYTRLTYNFRYLPQFLLLSALILVGLAFQLTKSYYLQCTNAILFLCYNATIQTLYFEWLTAVYGYVFFPYLSAIPQFLSGVYFSIVFQIITEDPLVQTWIAISMIISTFLLAWIYYLRCKALDPWLNGTSKRKRRNEDVILLEDPENNAVYDTDSGSIELEKNVIGVV